MLQGPSPRYFSQQQGYQCKPLCRELKRIDSLAMSPIFGHFGETVHGLLTLRAFRGQERFVAHNRTLVNASNRAYWGIQEVGLLVIMNQEL